MWVLCVYGHDFHEMHARLHGLNNLLTLNQINRTWFPFLSRWTSQPGPDMNDKVAAFTVTQKLYYTLATKVMLKTHSFKSVCLFVLLLYVPGNSYGHGRLVRSPNHTFSWASLNKWVTRTSCTYFSLLLTKTLLDWFSGREENDCRNYFMINLHKTPGWDRTHDPWICSQAHICSQTCYRLV